MRNPLEITFKGIPQSPNIEEIITEKFEKIREISNDVIKCHVVIEALSHHHQKGNAYCIRLDLKLAHFPDIIVKENKYFDDWKDRLIEYYPDNEARFMNEILVYLAHYDSISLRRLYDLAIKHKRDLDYMSFIEILENDGYIVENNQVYTFLSPFLKAFWKKDQPIYTETK